MEYETNTEPATGSGQLFLEERPAQFAGPSPTLRDRLREAFLKGASEVSGW